MEFQRNSFENIASRQTLRTEEAVLNHSQGCLLGQLSGDNLDEFNVYITAKQSGDLVNIEFRDTGPGISDKIKEQIFQPFKSFNKELGTGLGLAIAQSIVRDHGGELTVESKPNQGAIFIISLPVFDEI